MSEEIKMINIALELCGVFLCVTAIVAIFIGVKIEKKTSRYVIAIFSSIMLYLTSNIFGLLFRGMPDEFGFYAVRISNFCEFFFAALLSLCATLYFIYCIDIKGRMTGLRIFALAYYGVQVLLLIVSQFTDMYYYFDSNNVYHRNDLFWLSQALSIGSMVMNLIITVIYRSNLSKRQIKAFLVYIILPGAGLLIQLFSYGLNLVLFSAIIAAFILFFYILNDQTEQYCEKERENTEMRVAIMLSQIQPHFLYNTLTSIYCLCDKEPKAAKEAISQFSKYLRGNLESIRRETPILFSEELKHVQSYLALEKMSFEDELEIVYDIQADNFFLPALTVQPLVENAVKHGLGEAPDGGTVKISSTELPDFFAIEISDNGVGFDTENLGENHGVRVGIENVRSRLMLMCSATLEITSAPGEGTTALIKIPKEVS